MGEAAKVKLGRVKHFVMSLDDKASLCAHSVKNPFTIPAFCSVGRKLHCEFLMIITKQC